MNNNPLNMKSYSSVFGIFWVTGMVAFQGLPGTGFLRSVFLALGIFHLIWSIRTSEKKPAWPKLLIEAWLLGLLTLWLLIQSGLFSISPQYALTKLFAHWGKILLTISMAIAFVVYAQNKRETHLWLIHGVFFGFFIHVISTLAHQFRLFSTTGTFVLGESLLGNYGYVSPYVTGCLAFLLADLASRYSKGNGLLRIPSYLVWICLALSLLAQVMLDSKASHLMSVVLVLFTAAALISIQKKDFSLIAGITGVFMILIIVTATQFSDRWQNTASSIEFAIQNASDIPSALKGSPDPNSQVNKSDRSFTLRYVWGKVGILAITSNPLGTGYGSEGYGRFINEHYGLPGAVSSHSGWIDFTIDNGIPGLLLLFLLSGALIYRGWVVFVQDHNPVGLAMSLTVLNYIGRCAIDGHLVGSRLSGFAFVAAVLWILSVTSVNEESTIDEHQFVRSK